MKLHFTESGEPFVLHTAGTDDFGNAFYINFINEEFDSPQAIRRIRKEHTVVSEDTYDHATRGEVRCDCVTGEYPSTTTEL
jgi:hypothetical protein